MCEAGVTGSLELEMPRPTERLLWVLVLQLPGVVDVPGCSPFFISSMPSWQYMVCRCLSTHSPSCARCLIRHFCFSASKPLGSFSHQARTTR